MQEGLFVSYVFSFSQEDERYPTLIFYIDPSICNLNCYKCHNRARPVTKSPTFSFADVLHFYNNIGLKQVSFSGGECTLVHKQLKDYLMFVKDCDLRVRIETNGQNPEGLEDLLSLTDCVALDYKVPVSLDGYVEKVDRIGDMAYILFQDRSKTQHVYMYASNLAKTIELVKRYGKELFLRTVTYPFDVVDIEYMRREALRKNLPLSVNPFVDP